MAETVVCCEEGEIRRLIDDCRTTFSTLFASSPPPSHCSIAPGRVNLIGEHVDYSEGLVLPMAIPLYSVLVGSRVVDRGFTRVFSRNLDQMTLIRRPYDNRDSSHSLTAVDEEPQWSSYIRGVLALYPQAVDFDAVLESTIPIGGGLSSSAALELGVLGLLRAIHAGETDKLTDCECALLCQRAEHAFAGVPCGIMDQFVVSMARPGQALQIDCRSLTCQLVPINMENTVILVTDSGVRHSLASSEYGDRRRSVEEVARRANVACLRDLNGEQLKGLATTIGDELLYRRAEHVVEEIARVAQAVAALHEGNLALFGTLMNDSHNSLRDKFQVSCTELDRLVELATRFDGVFGSRMTGGGFGGCTVTVVRADRVQALKEHILEHYTGSPTFYECRPVGGMRVVKLQ